MGLTQVAVCDQCFATSDLGDDGGLPRNWIGEDDKMYCCDYFYRKAKTVSFDLTEKPLTLVKMLLENCLQQVNQIIEKENKELTEATSGKYNNKGV